MTARLVLDESSWQWPGPLPEDTLEQFLEVLETAQDRVEEIQKFSEIYQQEVQPGQKLCDILFTPNPAHQDLLRRLQITLDRLKNWDDTTDPNPDAVIINGQTIAFAPSIHFVQQRLRQRQGTACLSLDGARRGPLPVTAGPNTNEIHFVVDEPSHLAFYRAVFEIEDADEASYPRLAPWAFPDLVWVDGVWSGLKDFENSFKQIRKDVTRHLGVLNDHGRALFTQYADNGPQIRGELGSRGVDASPENGNTLQNATAKKARERTYRDQVYLLSWHTKIERGRDRIHFHPGDANSNHKVIIGIFHHHLPT